VKTFTSEYGDATIRRTRTSEETTITIVLSGAEARLDADSVIGAVELQLGRLDYTED
jgi:hypothetical protein